jgi:uncharacterized membrane protein YccC
MTTQISDTVSPLDQLQEDYKQAVDKWITAIRVEATLASFNHNVTEIDEWEHAAAKEEAARKEAKALKAQYESALREKFFHF